MSTPSAVEFRCCVSLKLITRCFSPPSASFLIARSSSSVSSPPIKWPFGVRMAIDPTCRLFNMDIPTSSPRRADSRATCERRLFPERLETLHGIGLPGLDLEHLVVPLLRLHAIARVLVGLGQPDHRLHVARVDRDRVFERLDRAGPILLQQRAVAELLPGHRRILA